MLLNPDTEEQLKVEANRFINKPLFWHRGTWNSEGAHREAIHQIARNSGADQILVVDADEIWDVGVAEEALQASADRPEGTVRVRFLHFWRSFGWACEDPCMPTRILNIRNDQTKEWYLSPQRVPVYHLGYAQNEAITRYKMDIHGHRGEWRPEWWETKFLNWKPGTIDVHPTCKENFWIPKPFDRERLKFLLGDHPYFGKELIT